MHLKKGFIICLCMSMLYLSGHTQNVSWYPNTGAVKVTGGTKTISTYIATTDADVRKWMTHLNVATLFAEFPSQGGITATNMDVGGSVEFRVYAYNKTNRTKGAQLYGCKSTQNGFQEISLGNVTATVRTGWTTTVPSTDIATLIQNLDIYTPTTGCSITGAAQKALTWALATGGTYTQNTGLKNASKALVSGAALGKIDFEITNQLKTSTNFPAKDAINALPSNCQPYATPLQPVVVELTITNATVTKLQLPALNGSITPHELFHVFNNTDYSNLFANNRVTVISHRGYWCNAGVAQNSKAAIQAAQARPDVDAIEIDVRSTYDKKGICFHDDKPQKILQGTRTSYPSSSVYDLNLSTLQGFKLYDRFDWETSEYLLSLKDAFEYIKNNNITKPINLDIGIPDEVPQSGGDVSGKPFFDAAFLEAVGLACQNGLTDRIVFKGKYTYDDPIWNTVRDTLSNYWTTGTPSGHPIITYTPKLGDDIQDYLNYRNNWLDLSKGRGIPHVAVVGMEVRLKKYNNGGSNTPVQEFLKASIPIVQAAYYNATVPLRVGVFSETPTSCQGYWTKSAVEKYINFEEEYRNNFDWVLNNNYNYIITDIPEILKTIINARF